MQDVTSFVKAQSPLSLNATGSESKKSGSSKGESKNFFSMMLAQLSQSKESVKSETKQSTITTLKEETKNTKSTEEKAKSVDEHLLEDLLKVVEALKTNSPLPLLPTLKSSSGLEKIINNATALKEFGEVKNIGDLLTLSKKYDLGLEKISFSKESLESLQKEFPTLAKSTFFEQLSNEVENQKSGDDAQTTLSSSSLNPLEKNVKKSDVIEQPSALKELMSKEPKEIKSIKADEASTLATEKASSKETPHIDTQNKELKKTTPTTTETVTQKAITPVNEELKADKKNKTESTPLVAALADGEEEEALTKSAPITRTNEPKLETANAHKGLTEAILQTIKTDKPNTQKPIASEQETQISITSTAEESVITESIENTPMMTETKTNPKQEIVSKQTTVLPKESLGQFANDLKEKIEAYKPPIMKVELSLFPKSLGEVDVTLLTRGNNLHVNITSTTSTMTLFTQNQAEFKNALINMGFHNLEMNFSDQRGQEQGQQHHQKNAPTGFFDELSEENLAEIATTVELVVPRYV
ncbi:MAG: flagellar hook-length control protein FliK [Sulfurospirillum sp.]|nr:flagellar hook-length control protein FliK [Sulfurospirillum sp.]